MSSVTFYETASKMLALTLNRLGDLSGYGTDVPGYNLTQHGGYPSLKSATGAPPMTPAGALTSIPADESTLKLYTSSTLPADSWVQLSAPADGHYTYFSDYSSVFTAITWDGPVVSYYLASAKINGVNYIGVLAVRTDEGNVGWGFFYSPSGATLYNNSNISLDPGDKGFVPAGNKGHRPTGGGIDSGWKPVYPTDELEQPGAPDESVASAVRTGFLNIYQLNEANLVKLGKCLFDGLLAKLNNIFGLP